MSAHWIAVASAEHVRRGLQEGFMQVCHGKEGPLMRIKPEDKVIYYSPTEVFGAKDGLQSFTAIGAVREDDAYRHDMGGGFVPWRRNIDWFDATEAEIRPLLDRLSFTRGRQNWGYQFRFGVLAIDVQDFEIIADAMNARVPQMV
ncbi:EVE domain-containing protein [Phyllobacterium sp. OV277]|uniref:EVE domain-containing protein n=1 Tax=Phyllobacterium sp. OV277 TaxID=1882772 RepID=UPI0008869084|nr:EVE domain-containing protein [Phyllobacterium sp. OV277]SDP05394.1 EVE domain-containing protein [Phyllobacterium sp. OV277]